MPNVMVALYGSECWAVTKVDTRRIDALDQWCLRTLLGIKWHQFVRNEEVRRITKQPNPNSDNSVTVSLHICAHCTYG